MNSRIMAINREDNDSSETRETIESHSKDTCASVNAGVCGFTCRLKAWKIDKRTVGLEISESECLQIQDFSERLNQLTLSEVFMPITRNPVYLAADHSGCHPSCPVPAAVLKTAEVALEMALARDASIRFEPCKKEAV